MDSSRSATSVDSAIIPVDYSNIDDVENLVAETFCCNSGQSTILH